VSHPIGVNPSVPLAWTTRDTKEKMFPARLASMTIQQKRSRNQVFGQLRNIERAFN